MNLHSGTSPPALSCTREKVFDQGDEYFEALIDAIECAQHSIKLEVYIFDDDVIGERTSAALIKAAARHVSIEVIVDAAGSYTSLDWLSTNLQSQSIQVRIYHPLPWQFSHYPRSIKQGNTLDKALYFLRKVNRRDHRKLCIIDNEQLFTGSFNISVVHVSTSNGGEGWRDFGVQLTGPRVADIALQFDAVWQQQTDPILKRNGHHYLANISAWGRRRKNLKFEQIINAARTRVWLVSAYFAPSARVVRALKHAVKRGANVSIMVPARSDIHLFPFLTATYYRDLLSCGIRIYEFQPAVLHAKLLIADDTCVLGSTNFNHRSFLHDLELDVFLDKPESLHKLEKAFSDDLTKCIEVDAQASNTTSKNWLLKAFSRTLRYWM